MKKFIWRFRFAFKLTMLYTFNNSPLSNFKTGWRMSKGAYDPTQKPETTCLNIVMEWYDSTPPTEW